jgi:hypothetical protein
MFHSRFLDPPCCALYFRKERLHRLSSIGPGKGRPPKIKSLSLIDWGEGNSHSTVSPTMGCLSANFLDPPCCALYFRKERLHRLSSIGPGKGRPPKIKSLSLIDWGEGNSHSTVSRTMGCLSANPHDEVSYFPSRSRCQPHRVEWHGEIVLFLGRGCRLLHPYCLGDVYVLLPLLLAPT